MKSFNGTQNTEFCSLLKGITSGPPVSYNPASFTVSGKLSKGDITVRQTFLRIEYDEADIAVVDQPSDPKDPYEVHACAIDTVLP
ncbi:hypothetical protein GLOIN_2v1768585 [Rhizophagus irregularis DAOM 181602=DAOM 197198]|uniref:Uncharacterized protein n=1 Tax=Rhizophagus irregularis (strain DAOM 181602 / DAOM 197198 / MUCL 43194) TaxID=747089 RepID=A0A2P4QGX9_RHIID|nr:hypothetical protein GLOIN_2v1768585 [Rhizophagus irregularis DAOM 181602=DAOM 197198]POG76883.1 hypothetical protein GLOIN_2v1768585 [Rhizophagus irregularis DAOM 181602=DAOM 197198]|eukprot:XP_025183749.1 hypothetical protein GLOIN_2v1768585 [Rhizophagus irregularis DAOM 181602=DAOM 197198]